MPGVLAAQGFGPFQMEARSGRRTILSTSLATSGIDGVRHIRRSGFDPDLWVIALGTNDLNISVPTTGATDALINAMLDEIGPGHRVVWVNAYTTKSSVNAAAFNDRLLAVSQLRPMMVVADWSSLAAEHPDWISFDGVHTSPMGADQRNEWLAATALADRDPDAVTGTGPATGRLPLGPCDRELAPITVAVGAASTADVAWASRPPDGRACVHATAGGLRTDDPFGAGSSVHFEALAPVRVLEARIGTDGWVGAPAPLQWIPLRATLAPLDAVALRFTITVTKARTDGGVGAWPCPTAPRSLCIVASSSAHVVVHLVGWWVPNAP